MAARLLAVSLLRVGRRPAADASRSRQELALFGASSGNIVECAGMRPDIGSPSAGFLHHQLRMMASRKQPAADEQPAADATPAPEGASAAPDAADDTEAVSRSIDELEAELLEREEAVKGLQAQVVELTDSFKRSLAEMENLRVRTSRQVDQAQKFAIQGFAKGMLDVADNLQRAAEAVPQEVLVPDAEVDAQRALGLLRSLLEGVQMTNSALLQVFKQHGIQQFDPLGDKFDPNLHNAMFEVPDPSKEPGTVGIVTKRGYKMHDRVLRAAECGVVRAA